MPKRKRIQSDEEWELSDDGFSDPEDDLSDDPAPKRRRLTKSKKKQIKKKPSLRDKMKSLRNSAREKATLRWHATCREIKYDFLNAKS